MNISIPALPTQAEVLAVGRNVVSGVAPLMGLLGAFAVLTPDQQHQVVVSVNQIFFGLSEIAKGIKDAWVGILGLGFLVTGVMAWYARVSSKPANQVINAKAAIDAGKVADVALIPTGPASPINSPAGSSDTIAKAGVAAAIISGVK